MSSVVLAAPFGTSASISHSAVATATSVPFSDPGFPTPNDDQLAKIEETAHGTLPNAPPPPPGALSAEGITNIQFVNFNENFEVAYFGSLLHNVTTNVPGFEIKDHKERDFIIEILSAVLAQEELHAINAALALKGQNQQPILPCKYVFPTTNFDDAIILASTFTDVVLGTLQDVIEIFANNNDNANTRGVAAVIGQEGEQNGFYRLLQKKIPSSQPFLTTSTRDFAFSALQAFVVPGSCPNADLIDLKIFGVLNLETKVIEPKDQTLSFNFDIKTLLASKGVINSESHTDYSKYDYSTLSLAYINQQNVPIVEKLQNIKVKGTVVSFDAFFPFEEDLLFGLTLAAVTINAGPFKNAGDVANNTLFAPGLIEVL